jgi:hypothetical protein
MRIIPMLCTLALAAPLAMTAQEAVNSSWPIASGSRVRILSPVLGGQKTTGTVVSATKESILFQPRSLETPQALGVSAITRIDVSQGTHSRKLKGAGLGFLIGGLGAAAITAATWSKPKDCFMCMDFGRAGDSAFMGGFGGIVGALAGLIVGSHQTESWRAVEIPRS